MSERPLPRIANPRAADDPVAYMDGVRASAAGRRYKAVAREWLELRPGLRVLDVGCGPGDDARGFGAAVARGGRVLGIDTDPRMVDAARARSEGRDPAVSFRGDDMFALEETSWDRCYADRVLQLMPGREVEAAAQLARLLVPGGLLVACNPDTRSFTLDVGERAISDKLLAFVARRGFQGGELAGLLKGAGLEEIRVEACAHATTDFDEIDRSTPLRELAAGAEAAGAISADEHGAWREALARARAEDRFCFSATSFVVRARRPT